MKTLQILQIGDIHFPELKENVDFDLKDNGLPGDLVDSIKPQDRLQLVLRSILRRKNLNIDAILFCGDLTSYGRLDEYKECVKKIKISLLDSLNISSEHIQVVPGNHDISRKDIAGNNGSSFKKFEPIKQIWIDEGLDVLCFNELRSALVNGAINLVSINSCIGCGELRSFPEELKTKIMELLSPDTELSDQLFYEKLDTPAFADNHILELEQLLDELDSNTKLPIILSHHNLLPQSIIRIAPYTELLNSGILRLKLSQLNKPILYCHGHTHTSPIEVVSCPSKSLSKLICISAPKLEDGYNIIEVFISQRNVILGCIVQMMSYQPEMGGCHENKKIEIPFVGPDQKNDVLETKDMELLKFSNDWHYEALLAQVKKDTGKKVKTTRLQKVLLEARWLGLLEIDKWDQDPNKWIIRKG